MQQWWSVIIGAFIGAFIAAVSAYLVHRQRIMHEKNLQRESQEHEDKLQIKTTLLDKNLDEIYRFIHTEGLVELLGFFKDYSSPRDILEYLRKLTLMGHDFQELKGELESMRGMLNNRLFNPVTALIHDGIESNKTFTSRLKEKSDSKIYLKDHWLDIETIQQILASEESIFIESGSTLAYCMISIIDNIQKMRISLRPLRVCTNNVAIYMMLLFQKSFEPVLLPGKPDNQYAATFSDIGEDGKHGDEIKKFLDQHKVNILFTTASYLDIDYGPHVGSVQNHAMKRILNDYANDSSHHRMNIFVIAAEKINRDVQDRKIDKKCKLIFDHDGTENVIDHPEILEKTKLAWATHLQKPNNFIISGSFDAGMCSARLDELARQHTIRPFILSVGEGILYKLPSI